MTLVWRHSVEGMDWKSLSDLFLAVPLGHKDPADLKIAFSNSMFTCADRSHSPMARSSP